MLLYDLSPLIIKAIPSQNTAHLIPNQETLYNQSRIPPSLRVCLQHQFRAVFPKEGNNALLWGVGKVKEEEESVGV